MYCLQRDVNASRIGMRGIPASEKYSDIKSDGIMYHGLPKK